MTDTQTIEAIHRHLDAEPTDWTARLELADLYEDAGLDNEARYQRWAVKHKKAPEALHCRCWHWWKYTHGKPASIGVMVDSLPSGFAIGVMVDSLPSGFAITRQESEANLMRVLIAKSWPAPGVE